jgi:D-serine deaminase-like pyridoxal phosphate-dependent protein
MTASGSLIGQPKTAVDTPALFVDLDVMEANIDRIARTCRQSGVNWRPHSKGTKTLEIVRKQLDAGAIGITCAKLGEAEVMAAGGVRNILIANQIVGPTKIGRLMALLGRADPIVAVDSFTNVAELGAAAAQSSKPLNVVIEVNIGMNRAGVEPGMAAVELANSIAQYRGMRFAGLMAWESHAVTIPDPAEKERVIIEAISYLTSSARACRENGYSVDIVSCGGTGTFPYCTQQPGVTEVQVGGAIFSDIHYRKHYHIDFPYALTVMATVTSRPTPRRIVLDAGRKSLSSEAAMPEPIALPSLSRFKLSAEHATIELDAPSAVPRIGDRVEFVVGYSDSTVHLYDEIFAVRDNRVEAIWKIVARGKIN